MKVAFAILVAASVLVTVVGARIIVESDSSDPGSFGTPTLFGVGNVLQTGGICLLVLLAVLLIWISPILVARVRRRRAAPTEDVWLIQRAPSLQLALQSVDGGEPNPPYFMLLIANNEGIEIASPFGAITRIAWNRVDSISLSSTVTTRRVPTVRFSVQTPKRSTVDVDVLLSQPRWALFPQLDIASVDATVVELKRRKSAVSA